MVPAGAADGRRSDALRHRAHQLKHPATPARRAAGQGLLLIERVGGPQEVRFEDDLPTGETPPSGRPSRIGHGFTPLTAAETAASTATPIAWT